MHIVLNNLLHFIKVALEIYKARLNRQSNHLKTFSMKLQYAKKSDQINLISFFCLK